MSFASFAPSAGTAESPLPTIRPFVLPYKRFASPCLVQRAKEFLRDEKPDPPRHVKVDYRKAVKHNRMAIGYPVQQPTGQAQTRQQQTGPDEPADRDFHQPVVDHSLIWRMVGWLGGLTLPLDKAREMILTRNPDSLCHRPETSVNPAKARSEQRMKILETADHLLHVIDEWEATFGEKFFPRFATRSGFD